MECLNCKFMLDTEVFCPNCGQNTSVKRLVTSDVLNEAFQSFTNADRGILYLLRWLPFKAGIISREYVDGQRKKYFNPFTFLILTIGITSFLSANFNLLAMSTSDLDNPISIFLSEHINLIIFLTVPIIGLFTYVLFRKQKFNFAESLILSCYCSGIRSVFFALIVTPLIVFWRDSYLLFTGLYFFSFAIYYAWSCCQFFNKFTKWYFFKGFLVMLFTQISINSVVSVGFYIYYAFIK